MKMKDMENIAKKFSLDDWQYIAAQPEMFQCAKKTPEEVLVLCETLLLKRDGLLATAGCGAIWPTDAKFELYPTTSSTGPLYRGNFKGCRIEAAADLNSFQVIDDESECDTFERNGMDFEETHSSGVTDDWTEADFQTVIDEINRLQP